MSLLARGDPIERDPWPADGRQERQQTAALGTQWQQGSGKIFSLTTTMPCAKTVTKRKPAKQGSSSREGSITSTGSVTSTGKTRRAVRPATPAELPGLPYNPLVPPSIRRRAGSASGMDRDKTSCGIEFSANSAGRRGYSDSPWYLGSSKIRERHQRVIRGHLGTYLDPPWCAWPNDNFNGIRNGYGVPGYWREYGLEEDVGYQPNDYEAKQRPREQAMDKIAPFIRDRQRYRKFVERQLRPDGSLVRALHKSHGKSKAVPDDIRAATLKKLRRDHRQIDSDAAWASLGAAPGPSRPPRVSLSSSSSVSTSTGSVRPPTAGRAPRRPASRPRKPARPTKRRRG